MNVAGKYKSIKKSDPGEMVVNEYFIVCFCG